MKQAFCISIDFYLFLSKEKANIFNGLSQGHYHLFVDLALTEDSLDHKCWCSNKGKLNDQEVFSDLIQWTCKTILNCVSQVLVSRASYATHVCDPGQVATFQKSL